VADVRIALGGYGSQAWGEAPWGEGAVTLSATGQVGTATVAADANVSVTGVFATGEIGAVTVTANADVTLTGVSATGFVGTATVVGDANVSHGSRGYWRSGISHR
jgi:hypothetical protein